MKKVNHKKLISPVLFLVFNRLEATKRVFAEIRKAKPRKLFVAADGPRVGRKGEKEKCEEVRKYVLNNIDWQCKVKTLFRDKNLGCGKGPATAIDWFFKNVKEGIILEDDCLPNQSFFYFCEELLIRYRKEKRVFMIGGYNFTPESLNDANSSYRFSNIPHCVGWATWRRAWIKFNFDINYLPEFIDNKIFDSIWSDKKIKRYWLNLFLEYYQKDLDIWDYQWAYAIWKNHGICIAPNRNLISNIGYDSDGTHTLYNFNKLLTIPSKMMEFPINHPKNMAVNEEADNFVNKNVFLKFYTLKFILKKFGLLNLVKMIYVKFINHIN